MQDLQNAVAAAIEKIATSGIIEKAIETNLQKTIESIVNDQLRHYSDFGKLVEAKVKEALVIDPDRVSFPVYNDVILQVLQRHLDAYMTEQAAADVGAFMAKMLVAPPKEITLSDLLKQYVECVNDDHELDGESFELVIEKDSDHYTRIKFGNKDTTRSRYMSLKDYELSLTKDGEVYVMKFNDQKIEKGMFTGPFYGFERSLFQMWLAKTRIVFDEGMDAHAYDISFGDDEY